MRVKEAYESCLSLFSIYHYYLLLLPEELLLEEEPLDLLPALLLRLEELELLVEDPELFLELPLLLYDFELLLLEPELLVLLPLEDLFLFTPFSPEFLLELDPRGLDEFPELGLFDGFVLGLVFVLGEFGLVDVFSPGLVEEFERGLVPLKELGLELLADGLVELFVFTLSVFTPVGLDRVGRVVFACSASPFEISLGFKLTFPPGEFSKVKGLAPF